MSTINLAPTLWQERRRRGRRTRRWIAVLALIWGASGVAVVGVRFGMMNTSSSASTGMIELQTIDADLAMARADLGRLQVALSRQRAIGEHPDWSVMFTAIASSARDRVGVRRIEIETGSKAPSTAQPQTIPGQPAAASASNAGLGVVRISGVAWAQADASAFVIALDDLGVFRQVDLQSIVRERLDDQEGVGFTVTCQLGEPKR